VEDLNAETAGGGLDGDRDVMLGVPSAEKQNWNDNQLPHSGLE
jgi:hypothetical protein